MVTEAAQEPIETPDEVDDLAGNQFETAFTDALASRKAQAQEASEEETPTEEAPTEEASAGEAPAEEIQPSAFEQLLESAKQIGLPTDTISSEADLASSLMEQLRNQQDLANYGQQMLPYAEQFRNWMNNPTAPAPQAEQPERKSENEWNKQEYFASQYGGPVQTPEIQSAIDSGILQRDVETGMWTASPGFEVAAGSMIAEANAVQKHSASWWQKLTQGNPLEALWNHLEEPVNRLVAQRVEEMVSQRESQRDSQSALDNYVDANASWLFTTDPKTGREVTTERGQMFVDELERLERAGVQSQADRVAIAQRLIGLPAQDPPEKAATPPAQADTAAAQGSLGTAESSAPPAQPPVQPQDPRKTFLDNARRASHQPSSNGGTSSPDAPAAMDEIDLETLVSRRYKELISKN